MRHIQRLVQLVIGTILLGSFSFAQDSTITDSLLNNQKLIIGNQVKMMEEIIYDDPLEGKRFGVEFNPVGFLISTASDEGFSLAGSVSSFTLSDVAEVSFPFTYSEGPDEYMQFSVDSHYRYFLSKHRKGFYVSTGLRFTHIEGKERNYYWVEPDSDMILSDDKFGLTFGIGYRVYGSNGWYWGTSLFGGRYFTDKDLNLSGGSIVDSKIIIDMELLKIGKMF